MAYLAKPLPPGALFIPCRGNRPVFMVRPASFHEERVPTLCGHPAWAREVITTVDGYIVHRMTHPSRIVRNSIFARIVPKLFARPTPKTAWCTRCDLEEKLEGATVCGWCRNIIFPEDAAALAYDDSHIVDFSAHRTYCAWDPRIVVCGHKDCADQVQVQVAKNPNFVDLGTWHHRHALVVLPR